VSRLALLATVTDENYERLRHRLEGLTDDEFFWEPDRGCWTIYEDDPGHWTYHYAFPDPDPAPVTTIGWQIVHVATCKLMYHEWAFGPAKLTFPDIVIPSTAAAAIELLDKGQGLIRDELARTTDARLDKPVKTNWGELWPAWRIFWCMADHDAFHGGAIGVMRDIYHWRAGGKTERGNKMSRAT
jgi:hypothetical protein